MIAPVKNLALRMGWKLSAIIPRAPIPSQKFFGIRWDKHLTPRRVFSESCTIFLLPLATSILK